MTTLRENEISDRQPAIHRLSAVDLRDLSELEHAALRQGAINENLSLPEYLGRLAADASKRLLATNLPSAPANPSLNSSPTSSMESHEVTVQEDEQGFFYIHPKTGERVNRPEGGWKVQGKVEFRPLKSEDSQPPADPTGCP